LLYSGFMWRERLKFRRRGAPIMYSFDPCAARHGHRAWKRVDLDLWLTRVPNLGWRVIDAHGAILAVPDDAPDEVGATPPLGRWRSHKDGKSHEYDLVSASDAAP
jgi:hypothetical protein